MTSFRKRLHATLLFFSIHIIYISFILYSHEKKIGDFPRTSFPTSSLFIIYAARHRLSRAYFHRRDLLCGFSARFNSSLFGILHSVRSHFAVFFTDTRFDPALFFSASNLRPDRRISGQTTAGP